MRDSGKYALKLIGVYQQRSDMQLHASLCQSQDLAFSRHFLDANSYVRVGVSLFQSCYLLVTFHTGLRQGTAQIN